MRTNEVWMAWNLLRDTQFVCTVGRSKAPLFVLSKADCSMCENRSL